MERKEHDVLRGGLAGLAVMALALLFAPAGAQAHHGWGWATDEEFEITGQIVEVRLGNPHGEVTLDVDGERWEVEVGQPWRNEEAGLTEDVLQPGVEMMVHGHRSNDDDERLVKAEYVVIDGNRYELYPDRDM